MSVLAAFLLLVAQGDIVEPTGLRRAPDGDPIIDGVDPRPLIPLEFEFNEARDEPIEMRIYDLLGPERYQIVSSDAATRRVRVMTTMRAAREAAQQSGIRLITPPVQHAGLECRPAGLSYPTGEYDHVGRMASPCEPATRMIRDQIVIEAVDAEGRRLWMTQVADSRRSCFHDISRSPPQNVCGFDRDQPISARLEVPVEPAPARIRWYQVTEDLRLRRIGDTPWPTEVVGP